MTISKEAVLGNSPLDVTEEVLSVFEEGRKAKGIMNSLKKIGDPFYGLGTGNIFCIGDAGSGKSAFLQALMSSILDSGGRVFLLGGAKNFPVWSLPEGEVIQIRERDDLSFNPFSRILEEGIYWRDSSDDINMLSTVIVSMISPSGTLDDIEASFLEMALTAVITDKGANAEVSDVADWFLAHADQRAQDMGTGLYEFTKNGTYGKFFTGLCTINYSDPLIAANFEDIKSDMQLCAVVLQSLIVNIVAMMGRGDQITKFAIVIDDSWKFLEGKSAESLITMVAREVRTLQGILVTGTTGIDALGQSLAAKTAFDHSPMKCFLPLSKESITNLEEQGHIPSSDTAEFLRKLHIEPEKFSEVFIAGSSGYAVGRLILDPISLTFPLLKNYETEREENLTEQGGSFIGAIETAPQTRSCPTCNSKEDYNDNISLKGILTGQWKQRHPGKSEQKTQRIAELCLWIQLAAVYLLVLKPFGAIGK